MQIHKIGFRKEPELMENGYHNAFLGVHTDHGYVSILAKALLS